ERDRMEIQSLKLFITDADLAPLVAQAAAGQEGIEGLQAHLSPEGVQVQGQYATGFGFKVPFETVWQLSPAGSSLEVRLGAIRVGGMPANLLRGVLLRMIRDAIEQHPGVSLREDVIVIDVPEIVRSLGFEVQMRFTAVRTSVGSALIEAGDPFNP